MKNHYLLTVEDSEHPSYHGTYLLHHPTRSAQDLKMDYEVLYNLHFQTEEWGIGDVIRSLQKLGWKVVDIPEVKVAY